MADNLVMTVKLFLVFVAASMATSAPADGLLEPFRVEANGKPIDAGGDAAPFITDFDKDGAFDLLVGQRMGCNMRIFRNVGSNKEPKFGVSTVFKAGGVDASLSDLHGHV